MSTTFKTQLGVIGGSGIYQMQGIEVIKEHDIDTPFGKPSDVIVEGKSKEKLFSFYQDMGKVTDICLRKSHTEPIYMQ